MNCTEVPCANGDISEAMNSYNCMDYLLHADKRGLKELKHKSLKLAYKSFERSCSGRSFLLLNEHQLYEFLSGADLRVVTDIRLFHYLIEWYRYDRINRGYFMSDLMSKFIRIELLEGKPVACEWNMAHRPQAKLEKIVVVSTEFNHKKFKYQSYSLKRREWLTESWPNLATHAQFHCKFHYNNKLILSGGFVVDTPTDIVEYLDLESHEWYELPPLRGVRWSHVMAEVNGNLYVFGGLNTLDNNDKLLTVEKYDFRTRQWENVAPMPNSCEVLAAATLNGQIYVSSGGNDSLQCYNPESNKWTQTAQIGSTKTDIGYRIVTLNGYLYAIVDLVLWLYDPVVNSWSISSSEFSTSHEIEGCIANLNGRLIIWTESYNNKLELKEYYLQNGEWRTFLSECLGSNFAQIPAYVFITN